MLKRRLESEGDGVSVVIQENPDDISQDLCRTTDRYSIS